MNYKEALLFTGKCLILGRHPERKGEILEEIRSGRVSWEQVVWVSTSQYVFPALYLQLGRAGLLDELPADLVAYMEEFASMNRTRNSEIISQAREITDLLNRNGIFPVFLKGTALLLDGLYDDIAERMVGDIDFLVAEADMLKAAQVLRADGYFSEETAVDQVSLMENHYPELMKAGKLAAVEVHRWILQAPYHRFFNFKLIDSAKKELPIPEKAFAFSAPNQMVHNMMTAQVRDQGSLTGEIFLRQTYDLFLLSEQTDPLRSAMDFGHCFRRLNGYLAISSRILANPPEMTCKRSFSASLYLLRFELLSAHPKLARLYSLLVKFFILIGRYLRQIGQTFYRQDVRRNLFRKLSNPKWYGEHWRDLRRRL